MMLYIVSGFMRSGTSCMMDALSAGGMQAEWSRERDEAMNRQFADEHFRPNESYREVALNEYAGLTFPLKYDGKIIKVMSWGLAQMRRIPHRIIFMLRDPAEIADSMERSFGFCPTISVEGVTMKATEAPREWRRLYWEMVKRQAVAAETRADCMAFRLVHYQEVLDNPLKIFGALMGEGWPIVPALAAGVVDQTRRRVKAEVA